MTESETSEASLVKTIRRFAGKRIPIVLSTAIYHDLQIAGDDASELLEEISKRYCVSFRDFDFHLYFPDEIEAVFFWLASKLGFRDNRRPPLTVEHLLAVVDRREWFDPCESQTKTLPKLGTLES